VQFHCHCHGLLSPHVLYSTGRFSWSVAAMSDTPKVVHRWLAVPDQFDRFTRFLRDNGILMPTRIGIGVLVFLLGVTILLKRLGTHSVQTIGFPLDVVVAVLVMIGGIALPVIATSRERSYFLVVSGDFAIAVIVLAEANPDQRLLGCLVFGLVGSYVAFFHNLRAQLWHLLWSGTIIIVASIGVFTDAPSSASDVLGRIAFAIPVITVIPVVTQIALALLSNDAQSSELDPLTDLLNRRGLARRTSELLQAKSSLDQSLLVVVIDIDNFKHFNDTYGHDVGDRVILRTAYRLHDWARSDAAIARIGGDEFVVVQMMPLPYVGDLLARIHPVMNSPTGEPLSTTSIGIAVHNGGWPDVQAAESGLHDLHRLADSAMYESKRMGGNHVHSIVLTDQQPQQVGGRSVL